MIESINGQGPQLLCVTIGVGPKFEILARLAAESCRTMTGHEAVILGETVMRKYGCEKPHHLKFHLFEEFPSADVILYFDADLIFLKQWSVERLLEEVQQCSNDDLASAEEPLKSKTSHESSHDDSVIFPFICARDIAADGAIIWDSGEIGMDPGNYFNSGLFIVRRKEHAPLLAAARDLVGTFRTNFHDQTCLNAAIERSGKPRHFLPDSYNRLRLERSRRSEDVTIGHFRWLDSKPVELIHSYHQYWQTRDIRLTSGLDIIGAALTTQRYTYERVGYDRRPMRFGPNQVIREGSDKCERYWELSMDKEGPILWISGNDETTCWLRLFEDGIWRGNWLQFEKMPIEISPAPSAQSLACKPLIALERLELHIAAHCNLHCKGCNHASPTLDREFIDIKDLQRNLEDAIRLGIAARAIRVLGGEPLLHPEIVAILRMIKGLGIASRMDVVTNGLLLNRMSPDFWDLVDIVQVSRYPGIKVNIPEEHVSKIRENQFDYFKAAFSYIRNEDPSLVDQIWTKCGLRNDTVGIANGRLFKCMRSPYIGRAVGLTENDGIVLETATVDSLGTYLYNDLHLAACEYCTGTSGKPFAHEQLSGAEWMSEQRKPIIEMLDPLALP